MRRSRNSRTMSASVTGIRSDMPVPKPSRDCSVRAGQVAEVMRKG
jgi:hypothetical protein